MTPSRPPGLLRVAVPIVAIVAFVVAVAGTIWAAGSTLGYDFHAYEGAARRLLDGQQMYDPAVDVAGGFAIYLYPPPFALAVVPLAIVGGQAAVGIWTTALIAAFLAGIAVLPVGRTVRWLVLLLAAVDWPVVYSLKLGQVGPILFLLFAIGWRWLGRPGRVGTAIGLGTIVKVQPGLLLGWAALTGRWRVIGVAFGVLAVGMLLVTLVAGLQPWIDYPALLERVASPLTTPHNFTPGAIAYQSGASLAVASAIQWLTVGVALLAVVVSTRVASPDASYLVAVVASQLLSPLLWDHYAMLLLLPVAWLLDRRQWLAIAIPLATALPLVGVVPAVVYPMVFLVALLAPLAVGWTTGPRLMTLDSAR